MRNSVYLGFGIAAAIAAAVYLITVFGGAGQGWMEQAAAQAAIRCLTKGPCTELSLHGPRTGAKPPLSSDSPCAARKDWQPVKAAKAMLVTCTDKASYLYHMGAYPGADAEQWMLCTKAGCAKEAALFAVK